MVPTTFQESLFDTLELMAHTDVFLGMHGAPPPRPSPPPPPPPRGERGARALWGGGGGEWSAHAPTQTHA